MTVWNPGTDPYLSPPLQAAHLALLRRCGQERPTTAGQVLFRAGDRAYEFIVVLSGAVTMVDHEAGVVRELATFGPSGFLSELNILTGERLFATAVVREAGSVLAVPVEQLHEAIAQDQELSDLIVQTVLRRRQWLLQHRTGMQIDRIARHPAITVMSRSGVREVDGAGRLERVTVEDLTTSTRRTVPAAALFVLIGAEPHTQWLAESVVLDSNGFIVTGPDLSGQARKPPAREELGRDPYLLEASLPGVFAVGDVRSGSVKRVASAVGEGSIAIRFASEHLGRRAGIAATGAAPRP